MAQSPVQIGEVLAGKYRVEQVLGQGGMGIVVGAWHLELEQRVAVKFLLPEYAENAEASERFRREARAAVKIQSEHVARVVDVGTMGAGVPYMVMEFLDGRDLGSELERSGRFGVEEAVDCVFQTCLAIAEAHSKGVIHRDLKPCNLFLTTRADGSRLVKVLDFGISKSIHPNSTPQLSLTRTSVMIGSPLYMSPEQLESSKEADERSDVWSIGVILFEMLTGTVPFSGETLPQLVRAVLMGQHAPVHSLAPDVPEALSRVVARCLETNKEKRFRNISELVDALAPFTPEGERYSNRVRNVLALSQTPGLAPRTLAVPPAPIAAPERDTTGSGTQVSGTAPMPAVQHDSIPVTEGPATVGGESAPETFVSGGEKTHSTVNSWGQTRSGGSLRPNRTSWGIALALGGAGAVGAIAWMWAGARAEPPAAAAALPEAVVSASAVTVSEPAAPSVEPAAVDVGGSAAADPNEATPAVAPVPEPVASDVAVSTATSAAASATAPANTPIARPIQVRPKPVPAVKPPQPEPTPAPAKPDPFTDFGGRR